MPAGAADLGKDSKRPLRFNAHGPAIFAALVTLVFVLFALQRFSTFHNRTFDLAFYARMAWGMSRGDAWMPLVDSHVFGLHLSPILIPLGWVGHIFGTAETLLVAQGLSTFLAAVCLSRLGRRHLGTAGAWLGVALLVLHPNMGHVLSYEAHPGTLALGPLAWAIERFDARDTRRMLFACICVLLCREDLALLTSILGVLLLLRRERGPGLLILGGSLLWLGVFVGVLHPAYAPAGGSFDQHLGPWGDSPGAVLAAWARDPAALFAHIFSGARGTYLLRVLVPLAFLPLLAPRLLLVAAPVLALNLVSHFHTTPNLDSHYLTPAMPALVGAALLGASVAVKRFGRCALMVAGLALVSSYGVWGFRAGPDFVSDGRSEAAARITGEIPPGVSVSAPDALLPHLAERVRLHRAPPPDAGDDWTVVDVSHRRRYAGRATLLRTLEEPVVRGWLAREDVGLVRVEGPYMLFARGVSARESRHIVGTAPDGLGEGVRLSQCLRWTGAREEADELVLDFIATDRCPADLALRFADGRVDLLFEGELSPSQLRRGDRVRSRHRWPAETSPAETSLPALDALAIGLIRTSGAPPQHGDPRATTLRPAQSPEDTSAP